MCLTADIFAVVDFWSCMLVSWFEEAGFSSLLYVDGEGEVLWRGWLIRVVVANKCWLSLDVCNVMRWANDALANQGVALMRCCATEETFHI